MYQKEIIYIGLYKNGDRVGSAGFLKAERKEQESRLYLKVQNIPLGISGRFPVRVYNGSDWKEINGLTIRDGGGIWKENLEEKADKTMIQVMLSGGYMLEGRSKAAAETISRKNEKMPVQRNSDMSERIKAEESMSERINAEESMPERIKAEESMPERIKTKENMPERIKVNESIPERIKVNESIPERIKAEESMPEQDRATESMSRRDELTEEIPQNSSETVTSKTAKTVIVTEELTRRPAEDTDSAQQNILNYNLKEDKWEQILDTYENIHPYDDGRVYVKLEPKDFVILRANYQHLVNNSFLLHGFYNYRYIILGKEQEYYLGVPGVFYEREKMVAQMFGFEAFECPGGNVRAGEFGYYLRKVEL